MRILNVIITKAGIIDKIESFIIEEEQLSQEQVKRAEKLFENWCINNGWEYTTDEEDNHMEYLIENGYWESSNYDSVSLVWSNINN